MTSRDVWEAIIEPMRLVYLPPRHLRSAPDGVSLEDVQERALGQYVDALERFDRDTLDRTWKKIRQEHTCSIWPTPGSIEQTALQLQPKPHPPSEVEQKRLQAHAQAEAYAADYLKRRKLGRLAREQGWQGALRSWVTAVAFVEAQILLGLGKHGQAWDSQLVPPEQCGSGQEAFQAFCRTIQKPLSQGKLYVGAPPEALVQRWQEQARRRGATPQESPWTEVIHRLRERAAAPRDKGQHRGRGS